MKILLINNDAMVAKLFEAVAKKIRLELIIKNEFKELETQEELLLFVDDGVIGDALAFLKSQKHIFSVYLHKRNSPPMEGFNFCIKKPFLPTEILDIIKPKLEESGVIQKSFDDITKDDLEDPSAPKNDLKSAALEDIPEFNLDELDKLLGDDEPQDNSLEATNLDQDDDLNDLIEIEDEKLDEKENLSMKTIQEESPQEEIHEQKQDKESLKALKNDVLDKIDSLEMDFLEENLEEKNLEDFQIPKDPSKQDLVLALDLAEKESFQDLPKEVEDKDLIENPLESSEIDTQEDFKNDLQEESLQEESLKEEPPQDEQKDSEDKDLDDVQFLRDKQDTLDENNEGQANLEEDLEDLEGQEIHDEMDPSLDPKENDLDSYEPQETPNLQDIAEPKESKPQTPKTRKKPKPIKKSKTPAKPKKKKEAPKQDRSSQEDKEASPIDLHPINEDVFEEDMSSNVLDKKEIDEVKKILEQTEGVKENPMKQESEIFDIEDISEEEMKEALGLESSPSKSSTKETKPSQKQVLSKESDEIHFECKDEAQNHIALDKDIIEAIKKTPLGELKSIFDGMEMSINIKFSGKKNEKNR